MWLDRLKKLDMTMRRLTFLINSVFADTKKTFFLKKIKKVKKTFHMYYYGWRFFFLL
jgi:hypothetical protein